MQFETYNYTEAELVGEYNRIKDILFEQLEAAGILPSAENASLTYVVEVVGRGRFGKWWDKVFRIEKSQQQIRVLKIDHGKTINWDAPSPTEETND